MNDLQTKLEELTFYKKVFLFLYGILLIRFLAAVSFGHMIENDPELQWLFIFNIIILSIVCIFGSLVLKNMFFPEYDIKLDFFKKEEYYYDDEDTIIEPRE